MFETLDDGNIHALYEEEHRDDYEQPENSPNYRRSRRMNETRGEGRIHRLDAEERRNGGEEPYNLQSYGRMRRMQDTGKKSRLDAISNVPWDTQLLPSNDRQTQRRMVDHREREARYNAMNATQVANKPKVTPYPNSPDKVFPGTPCYRMLVDGVFRYIFIIDLNDPLKRDLYPAAWNGTARAQTLAYWIVPHFIYRREALVNECKARWKTVYNIRRHLGQNPPSKFDFESRPIVIALVPATQALVPATHGAGNQFDSFYAPGENNLAITPAIKDPVFSQPFNTRINLPFTLPGVPAVPLANYRIHPFPYNQPDNRFPQQPDPPAPPRPAPAPGAPPPAIILPHASELEAIPPTYNGLPNIDWIDIEPNNFEIGKDTLKNTCEQAEELDYAFALSIQGLRGASLPAVWNCIDPEYDVSDRAPVLAQFVKMYMEKFYSRLNAPGDSAVEDVVEEALYLHEEFCKGWVHRHHRTLSAEVSSAADSLVGVFFEDLRRAFPPNSTLTRTHMARYFRRKNEYSGEFANCLYHYMTSLEQMRGNRNASYRAMQTERVAYITAMKKMANMLRECFNDIQTDLQQVNATMILFDHRFIDWHYISAQLPAHHRDFDGYAQNFTLFRTRPGGRGRGFPPWQQMRV